MAKALILVVVALVTGLFVYWIVGGQLKRPSNPRAPNEAPNAARDPSLERKTTDPLDSRAAPSGPIEPPISAEQKEHDALERRREEFYVQLRRNGADLVAAARPSDDDAATLELYAIQDSPGSTSALLNLALHADAYYYGFRHIRFYAPNRPQSVERYRLDAEASADRNQNWLTFQK